MNTKPSSTPKWLWIAGLAVAVILIGCGLGMMALLSAARDAATASLAAPTDISPPTPARVESAGTARPSGPVPSPTAPRLELAPTATPTGPARTATPVRTPTPASRATATRTPNPYVVQNVKIYDLDGRLVYQGDVDLGPTLERIAAGIKDPHPNDGTVFQNRERQLPVKSDGQYYREYVVRTPGLREVGPQRLIMGKDGEAYYTPDHYDTFIRIK
jgi:filamentous hemagglutinin